MAKPLRAIAIVVIILIGCTSCSWVSEHYCDYEAQSGTSSSAEARAYRDCVRHPPYREKY